MAASLQLNIDGDEAGTSVCFNANDGKLYPSPHEPCDFKLGIGPCEGGDGNWYEIATTENSADKGGVLWYHSARMSKMEAPPGDYPRSSRLYDKECLVPNPSDERRKPGESWPEFFFYSRGRQVYGLTTFDWVHQKKDTRIPVPWAEIRVLYNPKGTRNITPGNGGIDLPIQIPYKDTWTPDFSKIEVIEDKEKGEVRVIIKPNAIQYGEIVWIDNAPPDRGEEEEVKTDATNPNRELDLKIKADLNGNIALKIKYFPNGDRSGSEFYTISLRKIIAMKKAQSQSK